MSGVDLAKFVQIILLSHRRNHHSQRTRGVTGNGTAAKCPAPFCCQDVCVCLYYLLTIWR